LSAINAPVITNHFGIDVIADSSKIEKKYKELVLNAKKCNEEKLDELLDRINHHQMVFISDVFFRVFLNSIFKQTISQKSLIEDFILQLVNDAGGCKPSNLVYFDWQNKPRIYSTYYSLMTLKLINSLEVFVKRKLSWCTNTFEWLLKRQLLKEINVGAFVEPDCPSVVVPENSFWAICSLKLLSDFMSNQTKVKLDRAVTRCVQWTLKFLDQKRKWSITRLFYALNILKVTDGLNLLDNGKKKNLIDFVERLHRDKGFQEFYIKEEKAGYREEAVYESAFIHSTFHALCIFKMVGLTGKYKKHLKEAKQFVLKHYQNGQFGVQINVRDYKYGPPKTSYETLSAVLILLAQL